MPIAAVSPLLVITDRAASQRAGRSLQETVAATVGAGAPVVLLRDKDLPRDERRRLGVSLRELTTSAGARLLVSSDVQLAAEVDADGLHLAAADALPDPAWRWRDDLQLGRSCHSRIEVARTRDEGLDHALVSPVAPTRSKPGYGPALGAVGLAELVEEADDLPLFALGGVEPDNAARWREAGAAGIAVMGGVMAAADPGQLVQRLLAAWQAG